MSGPGAPPPVPSAFQVYDSYLIDPIYQLKFTEAWAGVAAGCVLLSLPYLLASLRNGRLWTAWRGFGEHLDGRAYQSLAQGDAAPAPRARKARMWARWVGGAKAVLVSTTLWSAPGLELDLGQIILIAAYAVALLLCVTTASELADNPNRAGFLALAQLPPVFLFATKNSPLSLLLGPGRGWEKLNYLHRWAGRGLFLCAVIHGSLWIQNHLAYALPIIGPQKETSGVAALGVLCGIVLTSLKPVRKYLYQSFFVTHVLGYVSFFITICYHTPYAAPYIFPPLALYATDLLLRLLRFRLADAHLVPIDPQLTLINIPALDTGWEAGQHVRLRVFCGGARVWESHPLTICAAPPDVSCLAPAGYAGVLLGARVAGGWTRALNTWAATHLEPQPEDTPAEKCCADDDDFGGAPGSGSGEENPHPNPNPHPALPHARATVMLDGPYGGCALDLGTYARVLLVAGGAGATFTLGLLDDLVGRVVRRGRARGERTRRVEFVWCVRSFASIAWFAPFLNEIARVAARAPAEGDADFVLHISIFVTCLCDPEAVPPIPNMDVRVGRPEVYRMLCAMVGPRGAGEEGEREDGEREREREREEAGEKEKVGEEGGVDVDVDVLPSGSTPSAPHAHAHTHPRADPEALLPRPSSSSTSTSSRSSTSRSAPLGPPEYTLAHRLPPLSGGGAGAGAGGGLGVVASGPESLTRSASNAVARLGLVRGMELGGVGLHTELFSL